MPSIARIRSFVVSNEVGQSAHEIAKRPILGGELPHILSEFLYISREQLHAFRKCLMPLDQPVQPLIDIYPRKV